MVPIGRTQIFDAKMARPIRMAFKRTFSAQIPRLECQSRDQTRHCSSNFRAVRPPEGQSPRSGSNHLRYADTRSRQRGQGRTSEFWGVSNQAKRWSGCQKSSNRRCRQRTTTVFCELQARQGNGSTGKDARRATGSLEPAFYLAALLATEPETYMHLFQTKCWFEKFYHRTELFCSVNTSQRKTHKVSGRWSKGSHRDVPTLSRTKVNYLREELMHSTETNDITDTGSAAR